MLTDPIFDEISAHLTAKISFKLSASTEIFNELGRASTLELNYTSFKVTVFLKVLTNYLLEELPIIFYFIISTGQRISNLQNLLRYIQLSFY